MKNLLLAFIALFYSATTVIAQQAKLDSLKAALAHMQKDTDRINTLLQIGNEVHDNSPDSAILIGKQALVLSHAASWGKGVIISQHALGMYYELTGDINTALVYEDSALSNVNKYNFKALLGSIYNGLGNLLSDQNNYPGGLNYYFKSIEADSIIGEKTNAGIYSNIGLNYQEMGDYVKAEKYYLMTEKICEEENKMQGVSIVYGNLGILYYIEGNYKKGLEINFKALQLDSSLNKEGKLIPDYENIGLGYLDMGDYASALSYTFKAVSLGWKTGESDNIQVAYSNIGTAFVNIYNADSSAKGFYYIRDGLKKFVTHDALLDSAFVYEQSCLVSYYATGENDKFNMMLATGVLGKIYALRKDYAHAIAYYQRAYTISDSLKELQQKMEFSVELGHAYAKMNNFKMAAKYLDIVVSLKDTLFGKEKTKQIAEMEAKYENEKKQKEIEALAQKNEIQNLQIKQNRYFIFGLASLALLIALMAFLLIRQNRINNLNTKIELEQKLLRSQMNPHFIFNAMTSIQNYIYKEEPQEAANYLSSVFRLMRSILESSKKEYVALEKELSSLKDYLVLQQLCFHNKFDFTIETDPELDTENILIPPMMAQPFIENAIEHGIVNKQAEKGMINIRLRSKNELFSFEIEDNGVGREKAKEINLLHKGEHLSVATNITEERIKLLNKKLKRKISMQIVDLKNEKNVACGTKVIFSFPSNTFF